MNVTYLMVRNWQSALKDGMAKGVIDGLSRSGKFHSEAIQTLHARYDWPHLIHQTHAKMIMDTPALKHGNRKRDTSSAGYGATASSCPQGIRQ